MSKLTAILADIRITTSRLLGYGSSIIVAAQGEEA